MHHHPRDGRPAAVRRRDVTVPSDDYSFDFFCYRRYFLLRLGLIYAATSPARTLRACTQCVATHSHPNILSLLLGPVPH
jgi:hypothetical protein